MLTPLNAQMMHSFKWLLSKIRSGGLLNRLETIKRKWEHSKQFSLLTLQTFQMIHSTNEKHSTRYFGKCLVLKSQSANCWSKSMCDSFEGTQIN